MRTAHVHAARLTPDQVELVEFDGPWARACRDVWNAALDERLGALNAAHGRKMPKGWWPTYVSQCGQLKHVRRACPWVAAAPSHVLQQTLKDLDGAWAAWLYERRAGRPRFRARKRAARNWWAPSYRFPDRETPGNRRDFTQPERITRRWGRLHLTKLGWVRFRWDRSIPAGAAVTNVTLKRDAVGDWTVAFAIDLGDVRTPEHPYLDAAVGVDRGVAVLAATSDGHLHDRDILHAPGLGPDLLTDGERVRLRRLEQRKARQRRGSANLAKTRRSIAKMRRRQARRRAEIVHRTSKVLADGYGTVVVEDLKVRKMSRSAKGTVDAPGTKVAQKRGLNRSIQSKGWGMLKTTLKYKTARAGGHLVEVNPAHTSQTCHVCGHVDPKSRENQARWVCTACGHVCHADVNAACNILARGHTPASEPRATGSAGGRPVAACGALQRPVGAEKQEPQTDHARAA